ncbi:flagellar protein FlaG [Pseudoalteromonas pernae]|uniref:flagellar protein FlaG n=1 Tax=Pseudoalteromonas pernae TaxID=3118054 RepID=UPI003241DA73
MVEINSNQDVASILQNVKVQNRQPEVVTDTSKPVAQNDPQAQIKTTEQTSEVGKAQQGESVSQQVAQQQQERIEEIKESLEKLNEFIPIRSTNLIFEFDELGEPPVIKVVDRDSEEVIREIPPREFRDMAKALEDFADKLDNRGMIFNQSA